jgi:hypothetical protein
MRHPLLLPVLALLGGLALACAADPADPAAEVRGDCAPPAELSAIPIPVAGDWWTAGDRPPTLRLVQDGTRLQGDLAFSGVMRAGGTGTVQDGCIRLTFPPRPNATEQAMVLDGRLQSGGALDVVLRPGGGEPLRVTMRRPSR